MPNELKPGMPQNQADPKHVSNHSKFPLGYHLLSTERFGEVSCPFVSPVVPGDKIRLHCPTEVRTKSLKSPMMADLTKKRAYFSVPLQAILPINWEKVYSNPVIGDDVDDNVNSSIDNFASKVRTYAAVLKSAALNKEDYGIDDRITYWFQYLIFMEMFYSHGSLLNQLGYKMSAELTITHDNVAMSFDRWFDAFISSFQLGVTGDYLFQIVFGDKTYVVTKLGLAPENVYMTGYNFIDIRGCLEKMRDEPVFYINDAYLVLSDAEDQLEADGFDADFFQFAGLSAPLNFGPLVAYQMCVHHFISNDKIDYIYSAELYRQLVGSYIQKTLDFSSDPIGCFSYNGVDTLYDWFSGYYMNYMLETNDISAVNYTLPYFAAIFSFRHSLRFGDYFTGSRAYPLAVGDVNVNPNAQGKINVIDFSQKTQLARFLNAVNRSGRKIASYIANLFPGVKVQHDFHDPLYLGLTSDSVRVSETENTGADQLTKAQTITSMMHLASDKFGFEFEADRPGYVLCLSYYDIPRVYCSTIDRFFFHKNRFDMFNPFMQYVGDQAVFLPEVKPGSISSNFAYQLRNMEYKQRFSEATGGFVDDLPSWAFLADNTPGVPVPDNIGPDYIRSKNVELDRFYIALTGYSLGTYYHFIVSNFNDCEGVRPMAYAPSIM